MRATLVQFPVSHYCEKARWALDHAGIAYDVKNVAFVEHLWAVPRLAKGHKTVPVLVADGVVLRDSNDILRWADAQAKTSLFPTNEPARTEVESFVRFFDEELGRAVRVVAYSHLLPDLGAFRRAAFGELTGARRRLSELAAPLLRAGIRRHYGISRRAARSEETLRTAAERCDRALGRREHLVGDTLTAADVVGASLWAPLLDVPGTPWAGIEVPALAKLRDELMARPIGRWVHGVYARHRH